MCHWVIFGAGNFLDDILDAIESSGDYVSEIVLNQKVDSKILSGCSDTIKITFMDTYRPDPTARHIFGFVNPNKKPFIEKLKQYKGVNFFNLLHQNAYIAGTADIGMGNYLGPGCVVGPGTKLGDFNYLNRCSSLGHHTTIGSFNHIGPGATICGRCHIGDRNYIGAASCVRDGITLGEDIVLGMGAAAIRDLKIPGTYIGIPAKLK